MDWDGREKNDSTLKLDCASVSPGMSEIGWEGSLHLQYLESTVKDFGYCFKARTFRRESFKIRFIILRNHGGILEMNMEEKTTKRYYSER